MGLIPDNGHRRPLPRLDVARFRRFDRLREFRFVGRALLETLRARHLWRLDRPEDPSYGLPAGRAASETLNSVTC